MPLFITLVRFSRIFPVSVHLGIGKPTFGCKSHMPNCVFIFTNLQEIAVDKHSDVPAVDVLDIVRAAVWQDRKQLVTTLSNALTPHQLAALLVLSIEQDETDRGQTVQDKA